MVFAEKEDENVIDVPRVKSVAVKLTKQPRKREQKRKKAA
jgi:hypothetical protein